MGKTFNPLTKRSITIIWYAILCHKSGTYVSCFVLVGGGGKEIVFSCSFSGDFVTYHPGKWEGYLETLHARALENGATGGRVCGAGGGGTMLFFCSQNAEYEVKQALRDEQAEVFDFSVDRQGLYLWGY